MELLLPKSLSHEGGWGPSEVIPSECVVPFALFSKGDRLGKPADFSSNSSATDNRRDRYGRQYGSASGAFLFQQEEDEQTFSLVDTKPRPKAHAGIERIGGFRRRFNRNLQNRFGNRLQPETTTNPRGQQPQRKKNRFRWENRRRWTSRDWDNQPKVRVASIEVRPHWKIASELPLSELESASLPFMEAEARSKRNRVKYGRDRSSSDEDAGKVSAAAAVQGVDTLVEAGRVFLFNKSFDRITTRAPVAVRRFEDAKTLNVSASLDPILCRLAKQHSDRAIYATDTVLSMLMAAARSLDSWDILVNKRADGIWLDIRDGSNINKMSVNETSTQTLPTEPDSINNSNALAAEATLLNSLFSQQVLKREVASVLRLDEPNPFDTLVDPKMKRTSEAYRYRRFQLDNDTRIVTRCSVNAYTRKKSSDENLFLTAVALNEFDSKLSGGDDWRQKLDAQRGYIVATQFRSNACKVSRWIAQALLSGVDEMRIGFLSRAKAADAKSHTILGCQRFKPLEFSTQAGVRPASLWGSLKRVLDEIDSLEDGRYVLLRDPNEPVLRFYSMDDSDVKPAPIQ